jgi:pimeloyl-ACP methyl ester carboxylesterase
VLACGICGSDLHCAAYGPEFNAATRAALGVELMDLSRPLVMGHEFVGRVVAYGPYTTQRIPVGSRVVSMPALLRQPPAFLGFGRLDVPGGYAEHRRPSQATRNQASRAAAVPLHRPAGHRGDRRTAVRPRHRHPGRVGRSRRLPAVAQAERQRRTFPRAQIEILPGVGHWAWLEQPDRVAGLVAGFLRKRVGSTTDAQYATKYATPTPPQHFPQSFPIPAAPVLDDGRTGPYFGSRRFTAPHHFGTTVVPAWIR